MKTMALTCPNCSAQLEIDSSLKFAFCQYCGTKVMVETTQAYDEYDQPVANKQLVEKIVILKEKVPVRETITNRLSDIAKADEKLERTAKSLAKYTTSKPYIIGAVVSGVVAAILFVLIGEFSDSMGESLSNLLVVLWLCAIGLTILFGILSSKSSTRESCEKRLAKNKIEKQQLQARLSEINSEIGDTDKEILPEKYRDSQAVGFFYDVLVNQRATTLKEAINLYEQDKQNKKIEELQRRQTESLEIIKQQQQVIQAQNTRLNSQLQSNRKKRR